MITKKPVFLGYAVFYAGEPFMCSNDSVTKDKLYLKAHALFKLNQINKSLLFKSAREMQAWFITAKFRQHRKLTLRRVYAH